LKAQFLVIHYTATGPGSDVPGFFATSASQVSAHLVIRRNGTIIQCVPFDVVGWHAGQSEWVDATGNKHTGLNRNSIGIEIENWGALTKTGSDWISWNGQPVDASRVIEERHKFGVPDGGWETYTKAQIQSATAVSKLICAHYGIEEIVGHDDIAPGRKSDPGPAWNMDSFRAKVLGRRKKRAR
jgi:N-acetylmuramoyl-L-alanine amidase